MNAFFDLNIFPLKNKKKIVIHSQKLHHEFFYVAMFLEMGV